MDKSKLISTICTQLENDLVRLKEAARATYEAATHEESKPENEYDTRGLEASYLAGAQAQRVAEIEELIFLYRQMKPQNYKPDQPIGAASLVEVESNGKRSFVLIMSKGGGLSLNFEGIAIQTVTPVSPLGEALLGLTAGDVAVVEIGAQTKEYDIISVQ